MGWSLYSTWAVWLHEMGLRLFVRSLFSSFISPGQTNSMGVPSLPSFSPSLLWGVHVIRPHNIQIDPLSSCHLPLFLSAFWVYPFPSGVYDVIYVSPLAPRSPPSLLYSAGPLIPRFFRCKWPKNLHVALETMARWGAPADHDLTSGNAKV